MTNPDVNWGGTHAALCNVVAAFAVDNTGATDAIPKIQTSLLALVASGQVAWLRASAANSNYALRSQCTVPSGAALKGSYAANLDAHMVPTGDTHGPVTMPFFASEATSGASGTVASTTSKTAVVNLGFDPTGLPAVSLVDNASGLNQQILDVTSVSVLGGGQYRLTFTQSLRYPFIAGDIVQMLTSYPKDISLDFGNATITGSADRIIELSQASHSRISNANYKPGTGAVDQAFCSFDTGGQNNIQEGLNVDVSQPTPTSLNGGIGAGALALTVNSFAGWPTVDEYIIQIDTEQMLVTGGQGTLVWAVTRGYNGTVAAGHLNGAAVSMTPVIGIWLESNQYSIQRNCYIANATDTAARMDDCFACGQQNISCEGPGTTGTEQAFSADSDGGGVGCKDCWNIGCTAINHHTGYFHGTCVDQSLLNFTARGCAVGVQVSTNAKRVKYEGVTVLDACTTFAVIVQGAGDVAFESLVIPSWTANVDQVEINTGSVQIDDCDITHSGTGANVIACGAISTATCNIGSGDMNLAGTGLYGLRVFTGVMRAGYGGLLKIHGNAGGNVGARVESGATLRLGPGCDFDGCNTALQIAAGAFCSQGVQIVSGGAGAPQDFTFPDAKSTDRLSVRLITIGGAPTPYPVPYTITPGTKFTLTFAVGDTSTYEVIIEE